MNIQEPTPKLSTVAAFDDICRQINCLLDYSIEDVFIEFLKRVNEWRMNWYYCENEVKEWKEKYNKLEVDFIALERTLKNVRECFKREASLKEKVTKEKDLILDKLNQVKLLLNDRNYGDLRERERVMSCLELNLEAVQEKDESMENVLSDNEYDISGDELLEDVNKAVKLKRASNETPIFPPSKRNREKLEVARNIAEEFNKAADEEFMGQCEPKEIVTSEFKKTESRYNLRSHYNSQKALANRKHTFVQKKSFKAAEKCSVCGTSIGFYCNCFRCSECRACCHAQCKTRLPLPCIPYVSKVDKQGRFITIADYTSKNSKPCVPALIAHCVSEIERRGLNEPGLYRIPGSDREIKQLKEKILKSKNGVPALCGIDVHVLCGVIKDFLLHLDDPLLTRVLWRDFVEAAKIKDSEDRKTYIFQAISEMPLANRHSLAYMMLHLQKIASSPACRMPAENLAKIFGPTIVGYSSNEPVTVALFAENQKQIQVMEVLLELSSDYWENMLACPVDDACYTPSNHENFNRQISYPLRTPGLNVKSELLSPFIHSPNAKKIRPLF